MSTKARSRRSFLVHSVAGINAALNAGWIAANYPGILAAQEHVRQAASAGQLPKLAFFSDAQAAEIEAMTAQIIPTDETPGAREAHCLYFIDRALTTFARASQPLYTQGCKDLQAARFSTLSSEEQIKFLKSMEKTPFFTIVRTHTVIGFLARPEHGGNFDKIGWKLIGYDDSLNHKPPFGYYDAAAKEQRS